MRILITGGSSGIGEALAMRLADGTNNIFITGRSEEKLKAVCERIGENGSSYHYKSGDVSNKDDVQAIVKDAVQKMGGIDVLVANAGTGAFKLVEEISDEEFDSQFDTNVKGVWLFIREVLPHMKEQGSGQITVTSSNLGFETTARGSIYCATKFALQGMVGSIRKELEGTGVKIGTINPGGVDTPWFGDYDESEEKRNRLGVEEVVDAFMLMIKQGVRSNIGHILLQPANS